MSSQENTQSLDSSLSQQPGQESGVELCDFIPRHVLQEVQDSLSSLLHVPVLFVTWDGKPITRSVGAINTFCFRFICQSGQERPCVHCARFHDLDNGTQKLGKATIPEEHNCPSGLSDVAIPIVLRGKIVAYLATSQVANGEHIKQSAHNILVNAGVENTLADTFLNECQDVDNELLEQMTKAVASIVSMVTGLASSYAVNARLAIHDSLTGLYNRAYMWEFLNEKVAASTINGKPFAVTILDLDGFKEINDTYGHRAGDKVLQAVAQVLTKTLRPGDLSVRFGGDEFVMVLSDVAMARAKVVSERIRTAIAELRIPYSRNTLRIATSVGIATFSKKCGKSAEQLFATADKALYRDKEERHKTKRAA